MFDLHFAQKAFHRRNLAAFMKIAKPEIDASFGSSINLTKTLEKIDFLKILNFLDNLAGVTI